MEIKTFYFKNDINMVNLQTDYRAEEEYGVGHLREHNRNGKLVCQLHEFEHKKKLIPVLLIGLENDCNNTNITSLNRGEVVRKLNNANYKFDKIIEELKPAEKQKKNHFFSSLYLEDTPFGNLIGLPFLASFYHGDVLAIFPNPYCVEILTDEFKIKNGKTTFQLKNIDKEQYIKELKKRNKELFVKTKSLIHTLYESYTKHGFYIGGASGAFHTGINLYYTPKEDYEILSNYRILPYVQEGNDFVRKEKSLLDGEINEMKAYIKEEKMQLDKLEKVKKKLKKAGKGWYALGSPRKKDDGSWMFWLNPHDQSKYYFGWVTLEELKEWAHNKGRIAENKEA